MSTDAEHDLPRVLNDMSQVSVTMSASARNMHRFLLKALETNDEGNVASALGIDPSTLSRRKNDKKSNGLTELELTCVLLDLLGFKIIPREYECYDKAFVQSIFYLARVSMARKSDIDDFSHLDISNRMAELGY